MKKASQKEIIKMLAIGHNYIQICEAFGITKPALYCHLKRIRHMGVEPSNRNACRQFILPGCKPLPPDAPLQTHKLSPSQENVLRLIDAGKSMEEIYATVRMGWQTLQNTAAQGFARINIARRGKPRAVWLAQLRNYFSSVSPVKEWWSEY